MFTVIINIFLFIIAIYFVSKLLYYFRILLMVVGIIILCVGLVRSIRIIRNQEKNRLKEKICLCEECTDKETESVVKEEICDIIEASPMFSEKEKEISNSIQERKENRNTLKWDYNQAFIYGMYCNKDLKHKDIQDMKEEYKKYIAFSNESTINNKKDEV